MHRSNPIRPVALALLAGLAAAAHADVFPNPAAVGYVAEPNGHKSFVMDGAGHIALVDGYAAQAVGTPQIGYDQALKKSAFGAFDVVMQQCFAGGFSNDIAAVGLPGYSFASAARWDQVAVNIDNPRPGAAGPREVDNFTRSWRESAHRRMASGMRDHFDATINGVAAPAIAQDVFVGTGAEQPQYRSPGAFGMTGANDTRKLSDAAGPNGNRYAILVAWDHADERHGINIAREYNTLLANGIPANRIAVLHDGGAGGLLGMYSNPPALPGNPPTPVGPAFPGEMLQPGITIDALNSRVNFGKALHGDYFNAGAGANITAADSVFIYNTGHGGGTGVINPGTVGEYGGNNARDVRYVIPDADNSVVRTGGQGSYGGASSYRNIGPDGSEHFSVQLSLAAGLAIAGVKVSIDGALPTLLSDLIPNNPTSLDPLVPQALQHFQLDMDNGARLLAGNTVIDFLNVPAAALNGYYMTAALFDGGDQTGVGIVPTPGTLSLLALAGLASAQRRRGARGA